MQEVGIGPLNAVKDSWWRSRKASSDERLRVEKQAACQRKGGEGDELTGVLKVRVSATLTKDG